MRLHLVGRAKASSGSIPREGNKNEFLYEHKHCKSAPDKASQQEADGSTGFGCVTDGLHAVKPSSFMLQILNPLANSTISSSPRTTIPKTSTLLPFIGMCSGFLTQHPSRVCVEFAS